MKPEHYASQAARRFPRRVALVHGDRQWTFETFDRTVETLSCALRRRLEPGTCVALFMQNRAEYMLLQFALERARLVRVPLNSRHTALEVENLLKDCEAGAIFLDKHTAEIASRVVFSGRRLWRCQVDGQGADDGPTWGEILQEEPDGRANADDSSLDDLLSINYTSGSGGQPKGVMLTRGNWLSVYKNMLIDRDVRSDDRIAHIGPLTHASGVYFMPFFLRGATNVIVDGGVDGLLKDIEHHGITVFTCVPTVLGRIVRHPEFDRFDLRSLRWIGYGAEPIPKNTLAIAIERFGPILSQNYGLTEAMMTCACLQPNEHILSTDGRTELRVGSIGRPYTFVDILLRDPEGNAVPVNEVGEITIRAEHVMSGYWKRPEETRAVLRDGWLWSGDLGRMDEDGFIYLVGRSKEMLISGGFNIYPAELEACLCGCPGVLEAAVVGVPDAEFGEIAVAYLAVEPGTTTERSIVEYCKPRLGFRTPKRWFLHESLPKTHNGKIDKGRLRSLEATEP